MEPEVALGGTLEYGTHEENFKKNEDLQDVETGNLPIHHTIGSCTPEDISNKNNMSMDNDTSDNVIREIQEEIGQGDNRPNRKTAKEVAAERREAFSERFQLYQEKASKKLKDRKVIKLKSKPLGQIKDGLKRLSEDFNFNFRGIDGTMRLYLGKGKTERDVHMSTQENSAIFKSQIEK